MALKTLVSSLGLALRTWHGTVNDKGHADATLWCWNLRQAVQSYGTQITHPICLSWFQSTEPNCIGGFLQQTQNISDGCKRRVWCGLVVKPQPDGVWRRHLFCARVGAVSYSLRPSNEKTLGTSRECLRGTRLSGLAQCTVPRFTPSFHWCRFLMLRQKDPHAQALGS